MKLQKPNSLNPCWLWCTLDIIISFFMNCRCLCEHDSSKQLQHGCWNTQRKGNEKKQFPTDNADRQVLLSATDKRVRVQWRNFPSCSANQKKATQTEDMNRTNSLCITKGEKKERVRNRKFGFGQINWIENQNADKHSHWILKRVLKKRRTPWWQSKVSVRLMTQYLI